MADYKSQLMEVARQRYGDENIAAAVIADAEGHGTIEAIYNGDLNLPSKQDAHHWHERTTGVSAAEATAKQKDDLIRNLQTRVENMEHEMGLHNPAISPP